MKGSEITREDLYKIFAAMPAEKRRWARWVMSKQDYNDMSERICDGSHLWNRLFGKPVEIRDDATGISFVEGEPPSLMPDPPPPGPSWVPRLLNEIRRMTRDSACTHTNIPTREDPDEPPVALRGWASCSACLAIPSGYGPSCPNCTRPLAYLPCGGVVTDR